MTTSTGTAKAHGRTKGPRDAPTIHRITLAAIRISYMLTDVDNLHYHHGRYTYLATPTFEHSIRQVQLLINSLPKAGTHLVERALQLVTGLPSVPVWLGSFHARQFVESDAIVPPRTMKIGVDWPRDVSLSAVDSWLAGLPIDCIISGHVPFDLAFHDLLRQKGVAVILCIRDLRDVCVSHAHYVAREPGHFLHSEYAGRSVSEQIALSIQGCDPMPDIGTRARSVAGWTESATVVRFEDLVGVAGGGDAEKQQQCLARLCEVSGVSDTKIDQGKSALFGGTTTFRSGQIGQWHHELTSQHHQLMERFAGGLSMFLYQ